MNSYQNYYNKKTMTRTFTGKHLFAAFINQIHSLSLLGALVASFSLGLSAQSLTVTLNDTEPSCAGFSNGNIEAIVSGGTTPYSFLWSNGQTQNTIFGLTAGTYSVTVNDANGITGSATIELGQPEQLAVTVVRDDPCSGPGGSAEAFVTGGTPPYTYQWNNGVTTAVNPNLISEFNQVLITDANGCTVNGFTIVKDPMEIEILSNDPACAKNRGNLSVNITGGQGPFDILWSNGVTTNNNPNLGDGTYSVTVTDNQGCTQTATATVDIPDPIVIMVELEDTCEPEDGVQASVTISGGTPEYTIQWSNGATTPTTTLFPGSNFVLVIDANGCRKKQEVRISKKPVELQVEVTQPTCEDPLGSITVTPLGTQGPFTFLWNTDATTATISELEAGTYTVTVTDANGCTETTGASINEVVVPTLTVGEPSCEDGDATYTVSFSTDANNIPNVSAGVLSDNVGPDYVVSGIPVGTAVTIFVGNNDRGQCKVDTTISSPTCPPPSDCEIDVAIEGPDAFCEGDEGPITLTTTLTGNTTDVTYMWATSNQFTNIIGTDPSLVITTLPDETRTYFVRVTGVCPDGTTETAEDFLTIVFNPRPTITSIDTICADDNLSYTLIFTSNAATVSVNGEELPVQSNLTYTIPGLTLGQSATIVATSSESCTNTITVPSPTCEDPEPCTLEVDITAEPAEICEGESTTLTANVTQTGIDPASITYAWASGETTDSITVSPAVNTTYAVTVTGTCTSDGSTATATAELEVIVNPNPVIENIDTVCTTDNLNYTLSFTSNAQTVTVNGATITADNGTYSITLATGQDATIVATSAEGCTTETTIPSPTCGDTPCEISVTITSNKDEICEGDPEPVILTATVGGNTTDNSFEWSTTSDFAEIIGTEAILSDLFPSATTTYYVRVSGTCPDNSQTVTTAAKVITVNPNPTITAIDTTCAADNMSYTLSFNSNGATVSVNGVELDFQENGMYTVEGLTLGEEATIFATSIENCTTELTVPSPTCEDEPCTLEVDITADPAEICEGQSTTLTANITQTGIDTASITYTWSTAETTSSISVSPVVNTTYSVTVTGTCLEDGSTATATAEITILVNPNPEIRIDSVYCDSVLGRYVVEFFAEGNITIVPSTNIILEEVAAQNYKASNIPQGRDLEITATFGDTNCESTITVPSPSTCGDNEGCALEISAEADPDTICNGESTTLSITLETETNIDPTSLTFDWLIGDSTIASGNDEIQVSPFSTTTYTALVTGRCLENDSTYTATATVTVTVNQPPSITIVSVECADDATTYNVTLNINNASTVTVNGNTVTSNTNIYTIENIDIMTNLTVEVISPDDCVNIANISPPDCPSCTLSVDITADPAEICVGESTTLTATITAQRGIDPSTITYAWSTGEDTSSITVSPTTNTSYSVTVTGFCTEVDSVYTAVAEIEVVVNPTPELTILNTDCNDEGTGYSVTFSAPTANTITVNGESITLTNSGIYTVNDIDIMMNTTIVVTSLEGCENSTTVSPPDCCELEINATAEPDVICPGETTTLTAEIIEGVAPFDYEWFVDDVSIGMGESIMVNPTATTTYCVVVSDSCTRTEGATREACVTVTVLPAPEVFVTKKFCEGDTSYCVNFTTNVAIEEIELMPAGLTPTAEGQGSFEVCGIPLTDTLKVVVDFEDNDCPSDTIMVPPPIACPCPFDVELTAEPDTICAGESSTLTATVTNPDNPAVIGPFEFAWFDNRDCIGDPLSTDSIFTVTPTTTTTYYAKSTDLCLRDQDEFEFDSITVVVNPIPDITITDQPECAMDGLTYSVTFSTNAAGNNVTVTAGTLNGANPYTITGIPTGLGVVITVTDEETGCMNSTLVNPPTCPCPLMVSLEAEPDTICVGGETTITATVTGATGNVSYEWFVNGNQLPGEDGASITVTPGSTSTYTVEVSDDCTNANGQTVTASIEIVVKQPPVITIVSAECNMEGTDYVVTFETDADRDQITVSAGEFVGDASPYSVTGIPAGTDLVITVTNAPCDPVTVTVDDPCVNCQLVVDITAEPDTICEGESTILTANIISQTGIDSSSITYLWSTGETTPIINLVPLADSVYSVTVTGFCTIFDSTITVSESIEIIVNPSPEITAIDTICTEDNLNYILSFEVDAQTVSINGEEVEGMSGVYRDTIPTGQSATIIATNAAGCTTELIIPSPICEDPEPCELEVDITADPAEICVGESTTLTATIEAIGVDLNSIMYEWYEGDDTTGILIGSEELINVSPTVTTTYTIVVTGVCESDGSQVTARDEIEIIVNPIPVLTVTDTICADDGTSYSVIFNVTTIGDALVDVDQGTLSGTNPFTVSGIPAGTPLTITLVDSENGCENIAIVDAPDCSCPLSGLFFMNAFSPNGDGMNDQFRLLGTETINIPISVTIMVYDRWGEEVFFVETDAYDPDQIGHFWDGTFDGEVLPADVYGYYMTITCPGSEPETNQGNVTLVR